MLPVVLHLTEPQRSVPCASIRYVTQRKNVEQPLKRPHATGKWEILSSFLPPNFPGVCERGSHRRSSIFVNFVLIWVFSLVLSSFMRGVHASGNRAEFCSNFEQFHVFIEWICFSRNSWNLSKHHCLTVHPSHSDVHSRLARENSSSHREVFISGPVHPKAALTESWPNCFFSVHRWGRSFVCVCWWRNAVSLPREGRPSGSGFWRWSVFQPLEFSYRRFVLVEFAWTLAMSSKIMQMGLCGYVNKECVQLTLQDLAWQGIIFFCLHTHSGPLALLC